MRLLSSAACAAMALAAVALATTVTGQKKKEVVGITPEQVRWFTPSDYEDGRQRALLLGDHRRGGAWVDRVKIPAGGRVRAHTHPRDELITVIEGTWYLGEGERFDATRLKGYPAGSLIFIPAGASHFMMAKDGVVIVQVSGTGEFRTDYLEK